MRFCFGTSINQCSGLLKGARQSVLLLSFLSFPFALLAQPSFTKLFGPTGNTGYSVVQTADKGFVFCGNTSPSGNSLLDLKIQVIRTDSLGNEIWRKRYAQNEMNYVYKIVPTQDGGFAIGGYSQPSNSNYQQDMLIFRIGANGDSLWANSYGQPSTASEIAYDLIQTSDKGFLLAGKSAPAVLEYMHLIKTDSLGNTQWTKAPMSSYLDHRALTVREIPSGGYIVGGNTSTPVKGLSVIRLDSAGNTVWAKRLSKGTYTPRAEDVLPLADTGFLVVATIQLNANNTQQNSWLLWLKANGDTVQTKALHNIRIRSIVPDQQGGFWLAGVRPGSSSSSVLCKINSQGDSLWAKEYSFYPSVTVGEANPTTDGGLILVGSALDFNFETKAILIKTDGEGNVPAPVSVTALTSDLGLLKLYPNPATDNLTLEVENQSHPELTVLNVLGQPVWKMRCTEGNRHQIPVSGLPSGVYSLQVTTDKGFTTLPFRK
ncbi:MAG TPA: T9SS type A sorting domain-containing protein [Catalimonadaceae bacterium]|nr:T9SS type A sorting domain-containing protein [Catalimonadaceae bacterium]